jgi:S-adenosylmethionine synthetase
VIFYHVTKKENGMGRGNAVERAEKAKARLQEVSQAQSDIGKRVLDAIDNGVDPEIVVRLAEQAAKDIMPSAEAEKMQLTNEHEQTQETERTRMMRLNAQTVVTIRWNGWDSEVPMATGVGINNDRSWVLEFDAEGIAEAPQEIAEQIFANYPGKFVPHP